MCNTNSILSGRQYIIFIVCKIKCFVIDLHVVFIRYITSEWRTLNLNGTRTGNAIQRAASDSRLRPRGHWGQLRLQHTNY